MIDILALAWGFLSQTQLLSHITKRLVDSFGNEPIRPSNSVQTTIPRSSATVLNWERQRPDHWTERAARGSLVVAPPPDCFIPLLQEPLTSSGRLVVGAIVDDEPPYISWALVEPDLPSGFAGPDNVVGLLFAVLPETADSTLQLLQARDDGIVKGYRVVVLASH